MNNTLRLPSMTVVIASCLGLCAGCSQSGTPSSDKPADAGRPARQQLEQPVEPPHSEPPDQSTLRPDTDDPTDTVNQAPGETVPAVAGTAVDLKLLITANNTFGLDVYAHLKQRPGNIFFSPHSIATAFTMTYAGARANTANQMANVLHIPTGDVHAASVLLHNSLQASDTYELLIANRLWVQQELQLNTTFRRVTSNYYHAEVTPLDFVGATDKAREAINLWVKDQTHSKIPELIPVNALSTSTRLVLTNAVYFKGNWLHQFEDSATRPAAFYGTVETSAPFMHQRAEFPYMETPSFQALRLPYEGAALSMLVILPRQRLSLETLEETLDARFIAEVTDVMVPREVDVWIPKFTTSSQFKLNQMLKDLGMIDAFSANLADFSGITEQKGLFITEAIHKAFIEVNEEGSEAAAATAVVMGIENESRHVNFRADHPFVFLIRDDRNGAILFLGKLVNPLE